MSKLVILRVPWGERIPECCVEMGKEDTERAEIMSVSPLLRCEDGDEIFLNGRTGNLEAFRTERKGQQDYAKTYELPVPLRADEPQNLRHRTWASHATFQWKGGVGRPTHWPEDREGAKEPGGPAYGFVLSIMSRMQDFEIALFDGHEPWSFVLGRWIDPKSDRSPTMDIVVRHAQRHRARWADIANHPRRVLNRRRELVPLSRVEELDTQSMRWLSRQPGATLAERAGERQRILALARFENRNTLENRVFRDLLERTVGAGREYLALNADRAMGTIRRRTRRYALVQQYQLESRRLALELAQQEVDRADELVQPNYVLLHDSRYRHVWKAWKEIIHREHVMDDLWRWQRRSWAEFCKAVLVTALLAQSRTHCVAASPLAIRGEHRRGEWLVHDDPLAILAHEDKDWVIEILSGNARDIPEDLKAIGASAWIRFSGYSAVTYRYLAVWTVHPLSSDVSLDDLLSSASEACRMVSDSHLLAGGLLLVSLIGVHEPVAVAVKGNVIGAAFGPSDEQLVDGLGKIGDVLVERIESGL